MMGSGPLAVAQETVVRVAVCVWLQALHATHFEDWHLFGACLQDVEMCIVA